MGATKDRRPAVPRPIPVLDVKAGQVVRAVAGRRADYQPIRSRLVNSVDPIRVAEVMREEARTDELYVADLDALEGGVRQLALVAELARRGFRLWLDAGLRFADEAPSLFSEGAHILIVGTESLEVLEELALLATDYGEQVAVSLDQFQGRPIVKDREQIWTDPEPLADFLVGHCGLRRLILLDLSRVGMSEGPACLELCRHLQQRSPEVERVVGGGVRGPDDWPILAAHGADAVLLATALHDGRFHDFFSPE
jgi:phosphoribosylformimino-5-aminoimidazole carboxamide ribotide isomerase